MPTWLNITLQAIALAATGVNIAGGFVPAKYMLPIGLGISATQKAISVIAQYYNPDGTSAKAPYYPAK